MNKRRSETNWINFSSGLLVRALQMRWQPKDVLSKTDFRSGLIFIASSLCWIIIAAVAAVAAAAADDQHFSSARYTLLRCCWQRTHDAPNSTTTTKTHTAKWVSADAAAVGTTEREHNRFRKIRDVCTRTTAHRASWREREGRLASAHRYRWRIGNIEWCAWSATLRAQRIIITIIASIRCFQCFARREMSARKWWQTKARVAHWLPLAAGLSTRHLIIIFHCCATTTPSCEPTTCRLLSASSSFSGSKPFGRATSTHMTYTRKCA